MYLNSGSGGGIAVGTAAGAGGISVLPDTGGFLGNMGLLLDPTNPLTLVGGFALFAAGCALWRMTPRREE